MPLVELDRDELAYLEVCIGQVERGIPLDRKNFQTWEKLSIARRSIPPTPARALKLEMRREKDRYLDETER